MNKFIKVAFILLFANISIYAVDTSKLTSTLSSLAKKGLETGKALAEVGKDVPGAAAQLVKLPGQLKGIGGRIKRINKRMKCLPKPGAGDCGQAGCASRNECLGVTLEDFIELVKPATLFLGHVTERDAQGKPTKFQPGLVIVLMKILEKILTEAPFPESVKGSFVKLSTVLKAVNVYTLKFAQSLDDVFGFLAGISMQLKPDIKLPADIHVDALPAIEVAPDAPADEFTFDAITEVTE